MGVKKERVTFRLCYLFIEHLLLLEHVLCVNGVQREECNRRTSEYECSVCKYIVHVSGVY